VVATVAAQDDVCEAVRSLTRAASFLGVGMTTQATTCERAGLAEADLEDRLAGFLEGTGLFRVFRQVMGRALWAPCPAAGRVRADVLVLASRQGLAAGWREGPILFEVKRPGRPISRGLCQLMDYLACAWRLPNGTEILAGFGFLFPAEPVAGPLVIVMAQNSIGTCEIAGGELTCWTGEQRVVTVCEDGTLRIGRLARDKASAKFGG